MLDIRFIRENTEKVKNRLAMRGTNYDAAVDEAIALDDKRKAIIGEVEGHENASGSCKTTKYDHVLPKLAQIEDDLHVPVRRILGKQARHGHAQAVMTG